MSVHKCYLWLSQDGSVRTLIAFVHLPQNTAKFACISFRPLQPTPLVGYAVS